MNLQEFAHFFLLTVAKVAVFCGRCSVVDSFFPVLESLQLLLLKLYFVVSIGFILFVHEYFLFSFSRVCNRSKMSQSNLFYCSLKCFLKLLFYLNYEGASEWRKSSS